MTNPYPQQYAGVPQFAAPAAYPAPAQAAPVPQYPSPAPAPAPMPAPVAPTAGVTPAQFGTFVPATTGRAGERYDKFPAKNNTGRPLMVRFLESYSFLSTQGTTKGAQVPAVKVDVFDMTTQQVYVNASWTPVRLCEQVGHLAGDGIVYGVELYEAPTRSGNTMIAAREITDPQTLHMARQYAPQVAAMFDREHAVRQAEAAQEAAQQQQQQQPPGFQQPAGFGTAQATGYPAPQTLGPAGGFQPAAQPVPAAQPAYVPGAPGTPQFVPPQPYAQQPHADPNLIAAPQFQPPVPQPMPHDPRMTPGGVPPLPGSGQPAQHIDAAAVQAALSGLAAPTVSAPPAAPQG